MHAHGPAVWKGGGAAKGHLGNRGPLGWGARLSPVRFSSCPAVGGGGEGRCPMAALVHLCAGFPFRALLFECYAQPIPFSFPPTDLHRQKQVGDMSLAVSRAFRYQCCCRLLARTPKSMAQPCAATPRPTLHQQHANNMPTLPCHLTPIVHHAPCCSTVGPQAEQTGRFSALQAPRSGN